MDNKVFKQSILLIAAVTITFGLAVSTESLLAAWAVPTGAPPVGNPVKPLFTSSATDQQITSSGLVITNGNLQALIGDIVATNIAAANNLTTNGILRFTDDNSTITRPAASNLAFNIGGATRMQIIPNGNVGIANNAPAYKLDVNGDINFTGTLRQNGVPFASGGQWTTSGNNISNNNIGNVGIGVINPSEKLTIGGMDGPAIRLQNSGDANYTYLQNLLGGGYRINVNGLNVIAASSAGNVGIGNPAPAFKLDVTGDMNYTGTLRQNGNPVSFGGLPAGGIAAFYLDSCPIGWAACDGQNSTPDLRGMFIRGMNNFGSVAGTRSDGWQDPVNRAKGDRQLDDFKSHNHSISYGGGAGGAPPTNGGVYMMPDWPTSNTGGPETRPKNVALIYCMKQ